MRTVVALLVLLSATPLQAALYKWVDKDGITRYTTTLPPESARFERARINKQGRTLKTYKGALTAEEKAEEERRQAEEERLAREKAQAERRDRRIRASYRSVEDIEAKRDQKLKTLEVKVTSLQEKYTRTQMEYRRLIEEAINSERAGRMPPESLKGNLRSTRRENEDFEEQLEKLQEDYQSVTEKYEADLVRFKELKGIQ